MAIDGFDNIYICRRGGASGGYIGLMKLPAGTSTWQSLSDPDIANGQPIGRNDHVYTHIFASDDDDTIHLVYRHAAPNDMAYRYSTDGGATFSGGGVSGDDAEAPSGYVGGDGNIYAIGGAGTVYERTGTPSSWQSLGGAVTAGARDLPAMAVDDDGTIYAASFGGRYNVYSSGAWVGEQILPNLNGASLGFAEVEVHDGLGYAIWEEGNSVNNDAPAGTSDIIFATISPNGTVGN